MGKIETEKYPKEDQNQNMLCIGPVCVFLKQSFDFGGGLGCGLHWFCSLSSVWEQSIIG